MFGGASASWDILGKVIRPMEGVDLLRGKLSDAGEIRAVLYETAVMQSAGSSPIMRRVTVTGRK